MTSNNRTNEPNQNETKSGQEFCFTGAQVEAAAKAIADCHNPGMFEKYPENWRVEARAALVAAQGAARVTPTREQLIERISGEYFAEHTPGVGEHTEVSVPLATSIADIVLDFIEDLAEGGL